MSSQTKHLFTSSPPYSPPPPYTSTLHFPPATTSHEKLTILILSLSLPSFAKSCACFLTTLSNHTTLAHSTTSASALTYLATQTPTLVLAVDESLTKCSNAPLLDELKAYVKKGGLLYIGMFFVRLASMDAFDRFFGWWRVRWRYGDLCRERGRFVGGGGWDSRLWHGARCEVLRMGVEMKCLLVREARREERIFVPVGGKVGNCQLGNRKCTGGYCGR
jgi:hypothetical protein